MKLQDFVKLSKEQKIAFENRPVGKAQRFTGRKFTLIAKRNDETLTFENVGRTVVKRKKEELNKEGYRVDIIETNTIVNETVSGTRVRRQMEFAQQAFAAANDKFQPETIKEEKKETQKTFGWEVIENGTDAWLDNRPIVKVADRNAKVRAERKRLEIFNRLNAKNAKNDKKEIIEVYNRKTGKLIFFSPYENEVVAYLDKNKIAMTEVVIYTPNEVYSV